MTDMPEEISAEPDGNWWDPDQPFTRYIKLVKYKGLEAANERLKKQEEQSFSNLRDMVRQRNEALDRLEQLEAELEAANLTIKHMRQNLPLTDLTQSIGIDD